MNCQGCGVVLEPSEDQVNSAVDQVLQASLTDAQKHGGVCPLCGHCKDLPITHRPSTLFLLLVACLVTGAVLALYFENAKSTRRKAAANDALVSLNANADAVRLLGKPIAIQAGMQGDVKQDETGWQEARLTIPVHGPLGEGVARVAAGRLDGPWKFSTFEVIVEKQHKKVDLIAGRTVEYDANAYVDVHLLPGGAPEFANQSVPAPRIDADYPCVSEVVTDTGVSPQSGRCALAPALGGPVDRFEVDLRYGSFVLRETDLYIKDGFDVPLTRTYASNDWIHPNRVHAFGKNSNHPFDICPLGTRNPYTFQMIALEDNNFLYFDRISKGTGYADAVFQHSETSTRFYKAINRWNGNGWTTTLADGSEIIFPESYNAKNMAQGAPTEMRNAQGEQLQLIRDPQRNLQEIRTPHGHWIKFQYDGLSRINYATDEAGHWAKYTYTPDGMLDAVVRSTGNERHYTYDGDKMLDVKDEWGRTLVSNFYEYGQLVRQRFADGSVYSYSYVRSPDQRYVTQTRVTLPNNETHSVPVEEFIPAYVSKLR